MRLAPKETRLPRVALLVLGVSALACGSVALSGCGSQGDSNAAGGAGGAAMSSSSTTSSSSGSTSSTSSSSSSTSSSSTSSGGGGAPPAMERLHEIGRFDRKNPALPVFSWSNTSIGERLDSGCSGVSVELDGAAKVWFDVVVDGVVQSKLETTGGMASYPLAQNLAAGVTHDLAIVRRNEGFFGDVTFVGFTPTGCAAIDSPVPFTHAIEYVGDSITCGYGVEGAPGCSFSGPTENVDLTYAAIAAKNLGAAAHVIAYSGKGVHQNYGGDTNELMPELYLRRLTNDPASSFDFAEYTPEVVVVALGTNDFSVAIDDAAFVADYKAFLGVIRARRPSATIVCVKWAYWGAAHESLVEQAVAAFADPAVTTTEFTIKGSEPSGCDGHPGIATHARLGMELTSFLQAKLGW